MNSCTLIIATYNWPEALDLCLQSVMQQQVLPAEVLIADDGSGEETASLIRHFQSIFPVPLHHIWHSDEGFRLAAIRNKAIAAANEDYVIQIDGDLILHPYFVADHLEMRKPGYFVAGSRVMLSQTVSEKLISNQSLDLKTYGDGRLVINGLRNRYLRKLLALRYKIAGRHKYYVKGCNMAFYKRDLVRVNGYNEAFRGWGSEDRELAIRLINTGIKKQSIKMGGVCYHLYHTLSSKNAAVHNQVLMSEAIQQGLTRAIDGLNKHVVMH